MNPICLISEGIRLGEIDVPAFELRRGEALCLHVPSLLSEATRFRLIYALAGNQPVSEIRPVCRVVYAEHATSRRWGITHLFRRMRMTEWLQHEAGVSPQTAQAIREECRTILGDKDFSEDWPISHIPGDARALLGLQAAWAAGAEVIVFHLIGLGALGSEKLYEVIRARLDRCAAIELNHEYLTQGRRERDCMPGARCIELTRHSAGLASRQSA
jgi:hypothetical protein